MSYLPSVVTVAPASEPVSLTEARAQCHIDGSDFDTELAIYIQAAREHVERYTGLALVEQTVVIRASCFHDLCRLPVAPVQSITSVSYLDTTGAEQTLATTVYESVLVGLEPSIRLKIDQSWPSVRYVSDAVRVTAVCGFSSVPAPIKAAMLLTIENMNENRAAGDMPEAAMNLLSNYRLF
jgi:uncharacterized phiE125 gp8 family phage protein